MQTLFMILLSVNQGNNSSVDKTTLVSNLERFFDLNNIHISGTRTFGPNENDRTIIKFDYYKHDKTAKLIEKAVEENNIIISNKNDRFFNENLANEHGAYFVTNNFQSGKYASGYGYVFDQTKISIAEKFIQAKSMMAPISGDFAQTTVDWYDNPSYNFKELLAISNVAARKDTLNGEDVFVLDLDSAWGNVTLWIDKNLFRPLKVVTSLKNSCLMATGMTLKNAQKDMPYKTVARKETFVYFYNNKTTDLNKPAKIVKYLFESALYKEDEEIIMDINEVFQFDLWETFKPEMQNLLVISATAKNGTKFHIDNQPQIAYHLEDGQLVLSANHKFLNQISQTVFGGIGFWHRFFLTLGPLLVTGLLALWGWRRFSHKIQ